MCSLISDLTHRFSHGPKRAMQPFRAAVYEGPRRQYFWHYNGTSCLAKLPLS